jgi:predicted  nucleic acid-binding Zn-ribbon protein
VDQQLLALIDLQSLDTRIAAFEADAARLPKQIDAIHAALAEAKKTVETLRAKADTAKKDLRVKEKDLEVITARRTKAEARLWEVKNNTEYSAVLAEIEAIKQEKAKAEEEILAIMELQERLAVDIRDSEAQLKRSEAEARQNEAIVRKKLAAVEQELAAVRTERESRARVLPKSLLADYEKILRARGGVAVAAVTISAICGGCRVAIRPQAIQELKAASHLMICESCGRYLYWQESA